LAALETLRAYPLEKLAESGETEQAARRCAEFFRDLVVPAMHGSSVFVDFSILWPKFQQSMATDRQSPGFSA
jgi:hypothetical protein